MSHKIKPKNGGKTKIEPAVKALPITTVRRAIKVEDRVLLTISPEILAQFVIYASQRNPSECGGVGWVDNDQIYHLYDFKWVGEHREEQLGLIAWDRAEGICYAIENGMSEPNLQFHTHPGGHPFWSGVDLTDHESTLNKQFLRPEGEYYFIVYDGGMEFLVRRYWWTSNGAELWYQEGTVVCNGHEFTVRIPQYTWTKVKQEPKQTGAGSKTSAWRFIDRWWVYDEIELPESSDDINRWFKDILDADDKHPRQPVEGYYEVMIDNDPVFFMRDDIAELNYILSDEDKRSKYDDLFFWCDVPRYRWTDLYDKIANILGEEYYETILSDPDCWRDIGTYLGLVQLEKMEINNGQDT